jgi:hypothetical protein
MDYFEALKPRNTWKIFRNFIVSLIEALCPILV